MRHLTAAYRVADDGWHYVSMSRAGGHPLGYCADHEPHPTEAEARECYSQYLRDHIVLEGKTSNWCDCDIPSCSNPAKDTARITGSPYHLATLCPEHLTIADAIVALDVAGPAGDSWES